MLIETPPKNGNTLLRALEISNRLRNLLTRHGFSTVEDAWQTSDAEFLGLQGFGAESLLELRYFAPYDASKDTVWRSIDSAPKDGTAVLFGGWWKAFDISKGGAWEAQIFSWSSLMSNGAGERWIGAGFQSPEHWNVDWTKWTPLPKPPA